MALGKRKRRRTDNIASDNWSASASGAWNASLSCDEKPLAPTLPPVQPFAGCASAPERNERNVRKKKKRKLLRQAKISKRRDVEVGAARGGAAPGEGKTASTRPEIVGREDSHGSDGRVQSEAGIAPAGANGKLVARSVVDLAKMKAVALDGRRRKLLSKSGDGLVLPKASDERGRSLSLPPQSYHWNQRWSAPGGQCIFPDVIFTFDVDEWDDSDESGASDVDCCECGCDREDVGAADICRCLGVTGGNIVVSGDVGGCGPQGLDSEGAKRAKLAELASLRRRVLEAEESKKIVALISGSFLEVTNLLPAALSSTKVDSFTAPGSVTTFEKNSLDTDEKIELRRRIALLEERRRLKHSSSSGARPSVVSVPSSEPFQGAVQLASFQSSDDVGSPVSN